MWSEESITEADLTALGHDRADILIGHDAPLNLPTLDAWLAATDYEWPPAGRAYSAAGRAMFHRGFLQVRPRLYLGGHYHRHIDELVAYPAGDAEFQTRVVILDQGGSASAASQGILDVEPSNWNTSPATMRDAHNERGCAPIATQAHRG